MDSAAAFTWNVFFLRVIAGKLQRAAVDAAATEWGSGVQRASGPRSSLWLLSGADVPGGCLFCLLLLHHSPPHSQALQPSAGGDLRAGPPGWVWLSLHLWAGETKRRHFSWQVYILNTLQVSTIWCLCCLRWHQLIPLTLRSVITHQLLPTMWRHSEDGLCGSISLLIASFVGNIFPSCH